jgi:hypothetical protein
MKHLFSVYRLILLLYCIYFKLQPGSIHSGGRLLQIDRGHSQACVEVSSIIFIILHLRFTGEFAWT